jgi:D-3-phosphoglycerate dehydrogenase
MFRVLIAEKFAECGIEVLAGNGGITVDYRPTLTRAELLKEIHKYDGLIVRSGTRVTEDVIEAGRRLKVIGRAGNGLDNIEVGAAEARGVEVMNSPDGSAVTTAEYAVALMMSLSRRIPQAAASVRAGKWERSAFSGGELSGKLVGVIGLGRIGSVVSELAIGLRMRVIAYDPDDRVAARRIGIPILSLDEVIAEADVLTLHVPRTKDTEGLIGTDQFARMKKGVLLINASRGGVVDEQALLAAIESGKVAGAALDVFDQEPPVVNHPLLQRPEVIATPHIGASTAEAQRKVAIGIAERVRSYLLRRAVLHRDATAA